MYIRDVLLVLYTLYVVMVDDATRSEYKQAFRAGGAVDRINQ